MAAPRKDLTNIANIGTEANPVDKIYARCILKCENVSFALPTYAAPDAETLNGLKFATATNAITNVDNTTISGTVQINNTLGVTGTATMAAITASGVITANGTISMGSNIKLNAYWLSGDGGNEGVKVSAAGVVETSGAFITGGLLTCGGNIKLGANYISNDGDNEGISISSAGKVTCSGLLKASSALELEWWTPSSNPPSNSIWLYYASGSTVKIRYDDGTEDTLAFV